ncbi:enoyl-CoA hydratase/isomerase [Paenibacillus sp. NPDC055715]
MTTYQTIKVRFQQEVCFLQIYRPEVNNTINDLLVEECHHLLDQYEDNITIFVLEGLPEVFCYGADFQELHDRMNSGRHYECNPGRLFDLWLRLVAGPYITIAHVRGKVNAGGIGFVAASDIVIAERSATFSLSELLFGVFPSVVLPFLIRRIGATRANYLTLMTQAITAERAYSWGLADAFHEDSQTLLRKHLLRLRPLSKRGIARYKSYIQTISSLIQVKECAINANREMFSDPQNLLGIHRYIETGEFPWEE